jgi:hypothetical protein
MSEVTSSLKYTSVSSERCKCCGQDIVEHEEIEIYLERTSKDVICLITLDRAGNKSYVAVLYTDKEVKRWALGDARFEEF